MDIADVSQNQWRPNSFLYSNDLSCCVCGRPLTSTCFLARSSRACVFICCTSRVSSRLRRTNRSWFPMHSWRICSQHKPTRQQSASLHRFPSCRSTRTHQLVDSLPRGVELEDVCLLVQRFDGELRRTETNKPSIRPFTINTDGQIRRRSVCARALSLQFL